MRDLRGILARLAKADFPFVLVGGYAAFAHGATLVTQDVDVCCDFTESSLRQLNQAVRDLHPVHRMRPDRPPLAITPEYHKGLRNLYLDTDLGPLDLLGEVKGIGEYQAVKEQSIEVSIDDTKVRVLSLNGLIAAKSAMDRDRDKEAVRQLTAIRDLRKKNR